MKKINYGYNRLLAIFLTLDTPHPFTSSIYNIKKLVDSMKITTGTLSIER